jgi:hypothetical protein
MQRLEVSDAVRPLYGSLGFKGLNVLPCNNAKGGNYSEHTALIEIAIYIL